jgi:DNA-binding response OmpR family regulator
MNLLIIEDEIELSGSINKFLSEEGYVCEQAFNFNDASEKLGVYEYDIILLDITLPGGNGLDLLKRIKSSNPESGILIISAKNSLDDKLRGLDLGADDYIVKPFHLAELNSRINTLIRRINFKGREKLVFNEIEIDYRAREVIVNGGLIKLTRKEFDLLIYLITNKNRVLTKESIAEHIWGDYIDLADNFDFIYSHIKNIRKKIMGNGGKDYLKTIYGEGYKFTDR